MTRPRWFAAALTLALGALGWRWTVRAWTSDLEPGRLTVDGVPRQWGEDWAR